MLRLVMEAQHEVMNRKGQGGHADTRPYILVVGELPEVLKTLNGRDTDRVRSALELIGGLSGRKHGVVTVMLAQSRTHAVIGSVAMRNLVPASTVFRMRPEEAERMTELRLGYWKAVGPDPLDLEPGEFYVVGIDSGAVRVRVSALPPTRNSHPPPPYFHPLPGHFHTAGRALPR